jgi:hypothetical protein
LTSRPSYLVHYSFLPALPAHLFSTFPPSRCLAFLAVTKDKTISSPQHHRIASSTIPPRYQKLLLYFLITAAIEFAHTKV